VKPAPFEYHAPGSVEDACSMLASLEDGTVAQIEAVQRERAQPQRHHHEPERQADSHRDERDT